MNNAAGMPELHKEKQGYDTDLSVVTVGACKRGIVVMNTLPFLLDASRHSAPR